MLFVSHLPLACRRMFILARTWMHYGVMFPTLIGIFEKHFNIFYFGHLVRLVEISGRLHCCWLVTISILMSARRHPYLALAAFLAALPWYHCNQLGVWYPNHSLNWRLIGYICGFGAGLPGSPPESCAHGLHHGRGRDIGHLDQYRNRIGIVRRIYADAFLSAPQAQHFQLESMGNGSRCSVTRSDNIDCCLLLDFLPAPATSRPSWISGRYSSCSVFPKSLPCPLRRR